MVKQVTAVIIGAGARGYGFSLYALDYPDRLKIVGVADPSDYNRNRVKTTFNIADDKVFSGWEGLTNEEKFADCAIIATQDRLHKDPAVAAAKKGYHILLEKPMAVTYQDCWEIVDTCKRYKSMLAVCHVLRYTPQHNKIQEMIDSGVIGDVVNIQLLEPVGFWHFAHSYVRGKARNEAESTFSLLAKSGHDIDLIQCWMKPKKCLRLSSFGSLKHFRKEEKPEGAGERCTDCNIEKKCPYSTNKIYIDAYKAGQHGFPVNAVCNGPLDIENLKDALRTGPYGRCVYESDNDVMDNQVVNMQYEGGATVSFSMVGCTEKVSQRRIRIFGSMGEITCDMEMNTLRHVDFSNGQVYTHNFCVSDEISRSRLKEHGGADFYTIDTFVNAVATSDPSKILTGPDESLQSHLICFLADRARKENRVIEVEKEKLEHL